MIMANKPFTILSIDDDRGCQVAVTRYLTMVGSHKVEVAENGREGIKKAEQLRPDIILLDMSMPDMDGLEVIEALACGPLTRSIPVILITGADIDEETHAAFKKKENFMFLEYKPAKLSELLAKIENRLSPPPPAPGRENTLLSGQNEAERPANQP